MIWAIRIYRDYNSNVIKLVKVIDTDTMETQIVAAKIMKQALKNSPGCVANIYLDNNQLKVKQMKNDIKHKHFRTAYLNDYKQQSYCIITGYNQGLLSWIADGIDELDFRCGNDSTLGEIAGTLGLTIDELKFFNAEITENNSQRMVYVFNDNGYKSFKLLEKVKTDSIDIDNIFDDDWILDEYTVNQDGIHIKNIENGRGMYQYEFPEGIVSIEKFHGGINHVKLPNSLTSLGEACFSDLDEIISVKFGIGLKEIPYRCFENSAIDKVIFSGHQKIIGDYAFSDCTYLKSNIITAAVKIGKQAFCNTSFEKLKLINTEEIGIQAFSLNTKLKEIDLGTKLSVIRGGAFESCTKLERVYIPDSCKVIGKQAFYGCHRLRAVSLPKGIKLGENAFPKRCRLIYRET